MPGSRSSTDPEHKSPRESGEDSEDESEILEESPCGRWLKRREEVCVPLDIFLFSWTRYWALLHAGLALQSETKLLAPMLRERSERREHVEALSIPLRIFQLPLEFLRCSTCHSTCGIWNSQLISFNSPRLFVYRC